MNELTRERLIAAGRAAVRYFEALEIGRFEVLAPNDQTSAEDNAYAALERAVAPLLYEPDLHEKPPEESAP
jgi:hypothetical protein